MKKKILIIECIPKIDKVDEGLILYKFLKMTFVEYVHLVRRSSKQGLINYLKNKKDLDEFQFVHLSGHGAHGTKYRPIIGYKEISLFQTPKGVLLPEDFPKDCFDQKTVTLSACSLGNKDFVNRFMEQTSARKVIAPLRDVQCGDASMWFTLFYYYALNGCSLKAAFDRTEKALNHVRGSFQFWYE
jgi:hypothetical protein